MRDELPAGDLLREIAEAAWACGDPGVQYEDAIQRWHTSPNAGRISGSNPCSEYMHIDDSACNLASINLMKFLDEDGTFRVDDFRHTVRVVLTAQEIIVTPASYPTKRIGDNARAFRQLGQGYTNLGSLLMCQGLAYDSDEGRAWAGAITALLQGEAYAQSARLAARVGAYDGYAADKEAQDRVVRMHRDAALDLPARGTRANNYAEVRAAASASLDDAVALGQAEGRNGAPGLPQRPGQRDRADRDHQLHDGRPDHGHRAGDRPDQLQDPGRRRLHEARQHRRRAGAAGARLRRRPSGPAILAHVDATGSIEGAPGLDESHLSVFDCAFGVAGGRTIGPEGHVRMMAAVQPFVSGAISKTVNLPNSATVEDVSDIYRLGWELGLKAIAIYRDGSKRTQPLSTTDGSAAPGGGRPGGRGVAAPVRRRLPDDRAAMTHKFSVGGQEGYITVGLYDDGSPGEVFVKMSKQGSTVSGLMDSVAIAWSMALQHGVPVESLIAKYIDHRFEPSGFTGNPRIPMARSVVDYLARWMASKFLSEEDQRIAGVLPGVEPGEPLVVDEEDEAPEDQLSFGQVTESNGNGNGHAAPGGPGRAAAPAARLDRPDLLVVRQLGHGEGRHLPHLPDLRRDQRLRLSRRRTVAAGAQRPRRDPRSVGDDQVPLGDDAPAVGDGAQLLADRPGVGLLVALVGRRAALEGHAAGVLADPLDLGDLLGAEEDLGRDAGQVGPLVLDRAGAGAGLLDQGGRHARDRPVRQGPLAGQLKGGQAVTLGDRAQQLEPIAALADPPRGAERAVVLIRQVALVRDVAVEDAAVVDHPRDGADVVPLQGREHQPGRPRLERVEDDHGPVDAVAVALQAVDEVQREAVGRAGGHADRAGQALLAQARPSRARPRRCCSPAGPGCGAGARRNGRCRSARGCARWRGAGSRRSPSARAGRGR